MRGIIGDVFGMKVRVADSAVEFSALCKAARDAGAEEVGATERTDLDIVIDERRGLIVCRSDEVMQRLLDAIPENPPASGEGKVG